jgi:RimJ/RimL family protein N-acetyltransferase
MTLSNPNLLETERLFLRKLTVEDADFIFGLVNQPSFIQNIGDKGVRTKADAIAYIQNGPMASYERLGFGLNLVVLKSGEIPIGICGLLKRESLPDVDIGFAFLPEYWSQGYGAESAAAIMHHGREVEGIGRILAITAPNNHASIKLLEKLGFKFEGMTRLSEGEAEVRLFSSQSPGAS